MKTLRELTEQKIRFNNLWKYAGNDTRKKAREVWKSKYIAVHEKCNSGKYFINMPGGLFYMYAAHYAAKLYGGEPWNYVDGFELNSVALDIYKNLAIF